jgi:hypothetical protein
MTNYSGSTIFTRPLKDFGTWKIEGDCLVCKRHPHRYVDLERCVDAFEILDWILHYAGRINEQELKDLVYAIQVILKPESNYRGCCKNDPLKLLAIHLGKNQKSSTPSLA